MNDYIEYKYDVASEAEIEAHLTKCDADFTPRLSERVKIFDYSKKIKNNATRFEAWSNGKLVGMIAAYCNDDQRQVAYVTSVSVLRLWTGKGIADHLLGLCIDHIKVLGIARISLEVAQTNAAAIKLYEKNGFTKGKTTGSVVAMNFKLN